EETMERMIQNVLLTIIAILLIVVATSRNTTAQFESSGRYQLVAAFERMYRIDVQTGEVSYCDDDDCRKVRERND
ncbi:MAG: hypothetical protein ABGZ35_20390, partial [Planctomycetaceae bacterium]